MGRKDGECSVLQVESLPTVSNWVHAGNSQLDDGASHTRVEVKFVCFA